MNLEVKVARKRGNIPFQGPTPVGSKHHTLNAADFILPDLAATPARREGGRERLIIACHEKSYYWKRKTGEGSFALSASTLAVPIQ